MNKVKLLSLTASMVLALVFIFSCSGGDDPSPSKEPLEPNSDISSSSSSDTTPGSSGSNENSSSSSLVYSCQLSIGCIKTRLEDCLSIGGSVVAACQESSSSSSSDDLQPSLSSSSSSDETPDSSSSSSDDSQLPLSSSSSSDAMPSSSSSIDANLYSCQFLIGCIETTIDGCLLIGGSIVAVCQVPSSSSAAASSSSSKPSSSSVAPSSSSVAVSSSSSMPSSSSNAVSSSSSYRGLCAGFVEGTKRLHYGKEKELFCDERDGKEYVYVEIGTQTWMAENLNYEVEGSKCYGEGGQVYFNSSNIYVLSTDEIQANCVKYGRLYNWATAMGLPSSCNSNSCLSQIQSKHRGICPYGWHIPSREDWGKLYSYVGGSLTAGKYLKTVSGWSPVSSIRNLDNYGFSALPGGLGRPPPDGYFDGAADSQSGSRGGSRGSWWSEQENNSTSAYVSTMRYDVDDTGTGETKIEKSLLPSVRCLQD